MYPSFDDILSLISISIILVSSMNEESQISISQLLNFFPQSSKLSIDTNH
jgi:hypothetical protein